VSEYPLIFDTFSLLAMNRVQSPVLVVPPGNGANLRVSKGSVNPLIAAALFIGFNHLYITYIPPCRNKSAAYTFPIIRCEHNGICMIRSIDSLRHHEFQSYISFSSSIGSHAYKQKNSIINCIRKILLYIFFKYH
jgi:hypothetical protein